MAAPVRGPLERRIRYAGFAFFIVLIAVSIGSSFIGVLNGLDAKEPRDPLPSKCSQANSGESNG